MTMKKKIYVIGHRNPDTDSVVSAAAYAQLKQAQGVSHCAAVRAGKINPQTEYVFTRFKVPIPEYLPDLIPKAGYYLTEEPVTVREDVSLWEALEQMQRESLRVLPIVDKNGVYRAMLHYRNFARYIIANINPHRKSYFPVSIDYLVDTLRAKAEVLFDNQTVKKSPIVVAASYTAFFRRHLEEERPDDALVIMGDRWDLQEFSIRRKVRALILTNGLTLGPGLADLARENRVSVISSPYDTSSTAMLIFYSAPVGAVGDDSVPLMRCTDTVKKLRPPLAQAPSRCLPIGDEAGHVVGVLFEGDLIRDPNIEVILVDHNEPSQAVEGLEHYRIIEVIDHHRLGNLATRDPITFINKVVGATCTIITNLYREAGIQIEKSIASILLCGILSDTLILQSATATATDREAAEYLASLTGLHIEQLGQDLQLAAGRLNAYSARELVELDQKEYREAGAAYSVSQIETDDPESMIARKGELLGALETFRLEQERLFAAILVTDVTLLDSLLFVAGTKNFMGQINFPKLEEGIYILKGVVSRKKQLIPLLSELAEKAAE